ncbi:MAG: hypothetical protein LBB89_09100 [Treponema sp.]|jgi:hypothetical protein|nr:hypothetical protein [Treponema sp.]
MKRFAWYLLLLPLVFTVCASQPAAVKPAEGSIVAPHDTGESAPVAVSQEVYDNTLAEVRLFIDKLNLLIYNKDYAGWKNVLSDEFLARISSPEFLAMASESTLLRAKKIVLKTPTDYFLHVVVPARSNSRVDEIEFTAINAVKVFYLEKSKGNNRVAAGEIRRLRLYELIKKSGDTWKIID